MQDGDTFSRRLDDLQKRIETLEKRHARILALEKAAHLLKWLFLPAGSQEEEPGIRVGLEYENLDDVNIGYGLAERIHTILAEIEGQSE